MRNVTLRRGVVAGLGAAAGALAAAAFVSTAPIAGADDGSSGAGSVDYAGLASPAATFPELTYENIYVDYTGTSGTEYITTFTGTGMPTTVTDPLTLAAGTTEYGSYDSFSGEYLTTATTGYNFSDLFEGIFGSNAAGPFDTFEPLMSSFSAF